jgi:hypothetical protein
VSKGSGKKEKLSSARLWSAIEGISQFPDSSKPRLTHDSKDSLAFFSLSGSPLTHSLTLSHGRDTAETRTRHGRDTDETRTRHGRHTERVRETVCPYVSVSPALSRRLFARPFHGNRCVLFVRKLRARRPLAKAKDGAYVGGCAQCSVDREIVPLNDRSSLFPRPWADVFT